MNTQPSMYRKHGDLHVVNVDNVWDSTYENCLIPLDDPTYQAWLALGNIPLEQND